MTPNEQLAREASQRIQYLWGDMKAGELQSIILTALTTATAQERERVEQAVKLAVEALEKCIPWPTLRSLDYDKAYIKRMEALTALRTLLPPPATASGKGEKL